MVSSLSDPEQGRRGSYFQARYLSLRKTRVLILGKYVLLVVRNTIYEECHA